MSRQNKINPAHYTQRGRLTPDDAARELARQRSIGSQHTWQPVKRNALPSLPFRNEDADRSPETPEDAETSEDSKSLESGLAPEKAKPAARVPRTTSMKTAALTKAKQSKSAKTSMVKKASAVGRVPRSGPGATSKAKTGRAAKPSARTVATKSTRKAVLARSVGGPALRPLRAAKRRTT